MNKTQWLRLKGNGVRLFGHILLQISSFPSHRCQNKTLFGKVFIGDKMVRKENVCFC